MKQGKDRSKQIALGKRLGALLLALVMVVGLLPLTNQPVQAAADDERPIYGHTVDPDTRNNWQLSFDAATTDQVGRIWTDKSVYDQDITLTPANIPITKSDEDSLLVGLSVMSAAKSIVGQTHKPTDTILVLDMSGTMSNESVAAMVEAANDAIARLQDLNINNRVGVVLYNTSEFVLLELDRYTTSSYITDNGVRKPQFLRASAGTVRPASGVKNSSGLGISDWIQFSNIGSTYIQRGLRAAWEEFAKADTKVNAGVQAGADRLPVLVLMSDGAPSISNVNFDNPPQAVNDGYNGQVGNGNVSTNDKGAVMAFLTELSAAYYKNQMDAHYAGETPLVYTLGVDLGDSDFAKDVLNPSSSASSTISGYWQSYISAAGDNLTISYYDQTATVAVDKDLQSTAARNYVDRFYEADNADEMIAAFEEIVGQIIIQSVYYPTEADNKNLDGYVTITDQLGDFMEVKNVNGLVNADELVSGKEFAREAVRGSLGRDFYTSVRDRLGLSSVIAAEDLVEAAIDAKQIYYTSDTDFSSYIAWYANADEGYLGFCEDPEDLEAAKAAGAAYINRSYLFYGESHGTAGDHLGNVAGSGGAGANLMYISARVCTDVNTRNQHVTFKIPASLIPMQQYDVQIDGVELTKDTQATVTRTAAYPMRFYYEAGLRSDINELNVAEMVDGSGKTDVDGVYTFYSNAWTGTGSDAGQTVAEFYPSKENEFYYFTADTTLVDQSGNPITSDVLPDTVYYTRYLFEAPAGGWQNGVEQAVTVLGVQDWEINKDSDSAIYAQAQRRGDGTWYMPKGTPKTTIIENYYETDKNAAQGGNVTNTLTYTIKPVVTTVGNNDVFVTAMLGDNGLLKLQQAQGFAIHKNVTGEVPAEYRNQEFQFQATLTGVADTDVTLITRQADGTLVRGGTVHVDGQGVCTFSLKAGETAYIVGLTAGTAYAVEEQSNSHFHLVSLTDGEGDPRPGNVLNAEGTVTANTLDEWTFENQYQTTGELMIAKRVEHNLGSSFTPDPNAVFDFTLELTLTRGQAETAVFSTNVTNAAGVVSGGQINMTYADGENGSRVGSGTFQLKNGDSITIYNLPQGATYKVTETAKTNYSTTVAGIATNMVEDTKTNTPQSHVFVNTYTASPVTANVLASLDVEKTMAGREWLTTDSFTFILEQRTDPAVYQEIARLTLQPEIVATSNEPSDAVGTPADETLQASGTETTQAPGNETTETTQAPGNETTETTQAPENDAMDTTHAPAAGSDDGTTETTEPETTTEPTADDTTGETTVPPAPAPINGSGDTTGASTVATNGETTDSTLPPEVEPGDETVHTAAPSNAAPTGEPSIANVLPAADPVPAANPPATAGSDPLSDAFEYFASHAFTQTGDYYYRVQELAVDPVNGVQYDQMTWRILVRVTDADYNGQLEASVYLAANDVTWSNLANAQYLVDTAAKAEVAFENEYSVTSGGNMTLQVEKSIRNNTGVPMNDLSGYQFGVYNEQDVLQATITTDGTGMATFSNTYTAASKGQTLRYYVQEIVPADPVPGITYDQTKYYFTVAVVDNLLGGVDVRWSWDAAKNTAPLEVENIYQVQPAAITLTGNKVLTGRNINDGEFNFQLVETDANHSVLQGGIQATASNVGNSFQFSLSIPTIGTHYFIITEKNESLGGVAYDQSVYYYQAEVGLKAGTADLEVTTSQLTKLTDGQETPVNAVSFTNTYTAKPAYMSLNGTMTLTGRAWSDSDSFSFLLEQQNADGTWSQVETVTLPGSKAEKTFSFAPVKLEAIGGYTFRVHQSAPDTPEANMDYDDTVYAVQVNVADDGAGRLVVDSILVDNAAFDPAANTLDFENVYTPPVAPPTEPSTEPTTDPGTRPTTPPATDTTTQPTTAPVDPESPSTGDETPVAMLFALLALAVVGMIVLTAVYVKERKKKH